MLFLGGVDQQRIRRLHHDHLRFLQRRVRGGLRARQPPVRHCRCRPRRARLSGAGPGIPHLSPRVPVGRRAHDAQLFKLLTSVLGIDIFDPIQFELPRILLFDIEAVNEVLDNDKVFAMSDHEDTVGSLVRF